MLKETLKDLNELLETAPEDIKSIHIVINNKDGIGYEVKDLDDEHIKNAKYMALMESGVGVRMVEVAADIEHLIEGEEEFGKKYAIPGKNMLDTFNDFFELIAKTQDTKYQLKVIKK